jgi:hypothetical protein
MNTIEDGVCAEWAWEIQFYQQQDDKNALPMQQFLSQVLISFILNYSNPPKQSSRPPRPDQPARAWYR